MRLCGRYLINIFLNNQKSKEKNFRFARKGVEEQKYLKDSVVENNSPFQSNFLIRHEISDKRKWKNI